MKRYFLTPFILQSLVMILLKPLFWFFIRLKVKGLDHIRTLPRGIVFAPNHVSYFDAGLIPASLPFLNTKLFPLFYVAMPKSAYNSIDTPGAFIFQSFVHRSLGSYEYIPGQKNYGQSLKNHVKIAHDKGNLCIFIEGTMSKDGNLGEPRGGCAYLASVSGNAVVPVRIDGAFKMTLKEFFLRKRSVTVTFGAPLYFEKDQEQSNTIELIKEGSSVIMNAIRSL